MAISRCPDSETRLHYFSGNSRKDERARQAIRDAPPTDADAWILILRPLSGIGDCIRIQVAVDDIGTTGTDVIHKYLGADVDASQWTMYIAQRIELSPEDIDLED